MFTIAFAQALTVRIVGELCEQRIEGLLDADHLVTRNVGWEGVTVLAQAYGSVQESLQAIGPGTAVGIHRILQIPYPMGQAYLQCLSGMTQLRWTEITHPQL